MGRQSIIRQKNEKNKRIASKERFGNVARMITYEAYRTGALSGSIDVILPMKCTINQDMVIYCPENGTVDARAYMYQSRPAPAHSESLRVVRETRWGKEYWVVYRGAEVCRLIPRRQYKTATKCLEAICNG